MQPTGAGFHRGRLNGFDIGGPELLLASVSTDRTLRYVPTALLLPDKQRKIELHAQNSCPMAQADPKQMHLLVSEGVCREADWTSSLCRKPETNH